MKRRCKGVVGRENNPFGSCVFGDCKDYEQSHQVRIREADGVWVGFIMALLLFRYVHIVGAQRP
jgi:hypothetical protein